MSNLSEKKSIRIRKIISTFLLCGLAILSTALAFSVKSMYGSCGGTCTPIAGTATRPAAVSQPVSQEQSFEGYIRDTVFIGDSRTNGLVRYQQVPEQNVMAKDGENHQAARTDRIVHTSSGDRTIARAVGDVKPLRMIVAFGINGVAFMGEQTFMEEYSALLDELHTASPDSTIAVQSILPVSKDRESADPRFANSKIDRYNGLLKTMTEGKGFRYLDASNVLKDQNNCLAAKYDSGDGLHFNPAAYEALMRFYEGNRVT